LLDNANEEISVKQRRGRPPGLDHRQKSFEAAQSELFGGEALTLRLRTNNTPKGWHMGAFWQMQNFGQGWPTAANLNEDADALSSAPNSPLQEPSPMPLMLTPAEQALLLDLAAPIDQRRQPEFVAAVEAELGNSAAVGPGAVHRAARSILSRFWSQTKPDRTARAAGLSRQLASALHLTPIARCKNQLSP
jgi:hypothetical protein